MGKSTILFLICEKPLSDGKDSAYHYYMATPKKPTPKKTTKQTSNKPRAHGGKPFAKGNKVAVGHGRPPKGFTIADALRTRLEETDENGVSNLERFAQVVVAQALSGDVAFARLASNYVDGMPKQTVDANVTQTIKIIDPLDSIEDEPTDDKPEEPA